MPHLTELQQQVFDEAKKRLKRYDWFCGICMDDFPTDVAIKENFDDAVDGVVMLTEMWDNPNLYQSTANTLDG